MTSPVANLLAGIIDRTEVRPSGSGRPPMPTAEIFEALRVFLREVVQCRELRAADGRFWLDLPPPHRTSWSTVAQYGPSAVGR